MVRLFTMAAIVAVACLAGSVDTAVAGDGCCCPPPPMCKTLCVKDPCGCCSCTVNVCVPGCCCEEPCVSWRSGIFGRRIATYSWPCCGHSVKVVVNRRGDVKVRG